jgi:hypothetical protein
MKRITCVAVVLLPLLAPVGAAAASRTFQLTIAADKEDRAVMPLTVWLALPRELADARSVVLRDAAGKTLPGQLTGPSLLAAPGKTGADEVGRELHFLLPAVKAGETATFQVTLSTDPPKGDLFRWQDTPGQQMDLFFGDRPVLRYMYAPLDDSTKDKRELTYKVFHHLFDPAGKRLVTKGPGGLYTHHRGLFYGFNRITLPDGKSADTWHCTGDAHQSHQGFLASEAGAVLGRQRLKIHWHGPGKKAFAEEERELTVYHAPGGILVEFASRLKSLGGTIKLDGDPQHAGFQFRADQEVAANSKKFTYYLRPDGPGKPGETRNWAGGKGPANLPWNAMSFVLGNDRYTVCYLDKPTNPKEARYSERDYGRFGSYFVYEIDESKPLAVNYRLWLQEGEMTVPQVSAIIAGFVQPPPVVVK